MRVTIVKATLAALLFVVAFAYLTPASAYQPDDAGPRVEIRPRRTQNLSAAQDVPAANLRVDSALVLIPVQVSTRDGAPVVDLKSDDFRIYEEGSEQKIAYFAKDDSPVSVGLLFDCSASMRTKKHKSAEAAAAFFKTANADDEFFLVEFDERPRLTVPFTKNTDALYREISHTRPFGRTSLFDAIQMALKVMKTAQHDRKALVIVSDGGDNRSRYTFGAVKNAMLEADVQLYAMGIESDGGDQGSPEEANGPELLQQLSEISGGRHFPVEKITDLVGISSRIGELLRNQYLLGYRPPSENRDGRYHRVTVELAAPAKVPFRVQHRSGYYTPSE